MTHPFRKNVPTDRKSRSYIPNKLVQRKLCRLVFGREPARFQSRLVDRLMTDFRVLLSQSSRMVVMIVVSNRPQPHYSRSLLVYLLVLSKCGSVVNHPWPTVCMYFYTKEHSYYDVDKK
jgi:hypothetical protein